MNHRVHDLAELAKNRAIGAQPESRTAPGGFDGEPIFCRWLSGRE